MSDKSIKSNPVPTFSRYAAVCRWLELQSLRQHYATLQKPYCRLERDLRDRFWLAVGESEPTGPHSFRVVLEYLLNGDSPLHFVHESRIGEEPTPWIALTCKPLWSDPNSLAWFRRGVIALETIVAWFIFQSLTPWQLRHWSNWVFLAGVAGVFLWLHLCRRKQVAAKPTLPPTPDPLETQVESPSLSSASIEPTD